MTLTGLEPRRVWHHFELLSSWPRCSGACDPVLDQLETLTRSWGRSTARDAAGNLVVYKPASPGHEGAPPVILQAHVDMVCEQNRGRGHNFQADGLTLVVDNGWVRANGTTLGADNGIGVAVLLAILEDSTLVHPSLEVLFTFDEETDMGGAVNLDPALLTGRTLLNLDGEGRGHFVVGTAGGQTTTSTVPVIREPARGSAWTVELTGLHGGHSGVEIHRQTGNALALLARLLLDVSARAEGEGLRLARFEGGDKDNAIPREALAVVSGPREAEPALRAAVLSAQESWAQELGSLGNALRVTLTPSPLPPSVLSAESGRRLLQLLVSFPHGVLGMSTVVPGLVETSANLARVTLENERAVVLSSERSSSRSQLEFTGQRVQALVSLAGGTSVSSGYFPPWAPNPHSAPAQLAPRLWQETTNIPATVELIHAGLECSLFAEKLPGVDMISFGANLVDIHTPRERVEILSVEEHYRFTLALLEALS